MMKKFLLFLSLILLTDTLSAQRIDIRRGGLGTNVLSGIYTTPGSFNSNQFTATTNVVSIKSGWFGTNTINYGYVQIPSSTAPAVSPAGTIRYYFDGVVIQASANGSAYTTLGVAGSDTQVQFNYLGYPGADSGLTYNITNHLLTVVSNISVGGITNTSIYVGTGSFTNTGIVSLAGSIGTVTGITNAGTYRGAGRLLVTAGASGELANFNGDPSTLDFVSGSSVDYFGIASTPERAGTAGTAYGSRIQLRVSSGTQVRGVGLLLDPPSGTVTHYTGVLGTRIAAPNGNWFLYDASGNPSYLAGALSVGGLASLGGINVTNGVTNQTLSANTLLGSDANKKLVSLGSASSVTNIITGSATVDPASINGASHGSVTWTITGSKTNDIVMVSIPVNWGDSNIIPKPAYIGAADQGKIAFYNPNAVTAIDLPSSTVNYTVYQR